MNPIKIDVIETKLKIIRRELKLLRSLQKKGTKSLERDLILQHALCHSMQLAITAVIDIAQHVAAESSDQDVQSYAQSIELLGDLKCLPKKFASSLAQTAKLRNVLVHLYDNLNMDLIWSHLPRLIKDLEKFLKSLKVS